MIRSTAARYCLERGITRSYLKHLGLKDIHGGFTIPWRNADGKELFRQTRHIPPVEIDGKDVKATYPKDTEMFFNHLPLINGRTWHQVYRDKSIGIVITESVTKGAVLAQLGYAVLTAGSVWGHKSQKRKNGLIRGFDTVPWMGRIVRIMFDNDVHINHDVQDALFDLGKELTARGAIVEAWLLPYPEWEEAVRSFIKLGVDDFVASQGKNADAALDKLDVRLLDDPSLAEWGKSRSPPKPSVVDSLDFSPLALETLTKPPPPRQYVLGNWIGVGLLTILSMAGGGGKGFIGMGLAIHIATGRRWMNLDTAKGRVVLLCLEDSMEEVKRRLYFVAKYYADKYKLKGRKLDEFNALVLDNVRVDSLEGAAQPLHLITEDHRVLVRTPEVERLAQKLAPLKPVLVIPDPLNQLHTLNENDNSVGAYMTAALGYLRTTIKTAILVFAHVSKSADDRGKRDTNATRGAGSFTTGARSVVHGDVLSPDEAVKLFDIKPQDAQDKILIFTHTKSNYGPKTHPIYMVRVAEGVLDQLDETVMPRKDPANADSTVRLNQLRQWLKRKHRWHFSKTEITQKHVKTIFNCGRPIAEAFFDAARIGGSIRLIAPEDLPPGARKGSGERYEIVLTANQVGQHA
jgi:RecA-family ATPase